MNASKGRSQRGLGGTNGAGAFVWLFAGAPQEPVRQRGTSAHHEVPPPPQRQPGTALLSLILALQAARHLPSTRGAQKHWSYPRFLGNEVTSPAAPRLLAAVAKAGRFSNAG